MKTKDKNLRKGGLWTNSINFDVEEIMEVFTMGMTNDIDEIMRETGGYKPGKRLLVALMG